MLLVKSKSRINFFLLMHSVDLLEALIILFIQINYLGLLSIIIKYIIMIIAYPIVE